MTSDQPYYSNYLFVSKTCFSKFKVSDKMAKLSTSDLVHILQCNVFLNNDLVYDVQVVARKRKYFISFFHLSKKVVKKLKEKDIRVAVLFTSNDDKVEKNFKLTRDLDKPNHVSNGLIILWT